MKTNRLIVATIALGIVCTIVDAQQPTSGNDADALLKQALRYGDLYNWSDAAPLFVKAEQIYTQRGDSRNALYARLGRIRSTMEQLSLPEISEQLGDELDENPLLRTDNQLRLFCLAVRGDIDGELDAAPMRRDWEAAIKVAQELGDRKWQNRASGEIGFSMFLEGEMTRARQRVGSALMAAIAMHDTGAQIRYLAAIGQGLVLLASYGEGLEYLAKAREISDGTPQAGYQFMIQEARLEAYKGLGKLDAAEQLADELIAQSRTRHKNVKETQALITASTIAIARHDEAKAIQELEEAIDLAGSGGFKRLLADAEFDLADIYRRQGDLVRAEQFASAAAESTQNGGEIYLLPHRLKSVAELQASRGEYQDSDATYDRADDVLDTMIGNLRSIQAKIGLITTMSEIYSEHFALVADHFKDTYKAYSVLERARGRSTTDLLMSGKPPDAPEEEQFEKQVSRFNLELSRAKSRAQIREIRDKTFVAEEGRWTASASNPWKTHSWQTIPLEQIQQALARDTVLLEYVVAEPHSYCVVITRDGGRIISLPGRSTVENLVRAYVNTLKTQSSDLRQGRELYSMLLGSISEADKKSRLIIVPDGCLHLLPFDSLVDRAGRYVVYTKTMLYAPSASAYYLLNLTSQVQSRNRRSLLGIGGIPYSEAADLNRLVMLRGYGSKPLPTLPGSKEEVLAAKAAFRDSADTLLTGFDATESAFKRSSLAQRAVIHMAVHGIADEKNSQRAALILLGDSKSDEDGILEANEIIPLQMNADLVVLSACDTAVGRLQGEEGISNLSRAFLLAGSRTVVSTLWNVDDTAALYVMKRFYLHLREGKPTADALTMAKRDLLKTYTGHAIPYYWASYKLEGAGGHSISFDSRN
jgi:CHAT domain-containing protein/tetratricopeptide (TPR) repeat protein